MKKLFVLTLFFWAVSAQADILEDDTLGEFQAETQSAQQENANEEYKNSSEGIKAKKALKNQKQVSITFTGGVEFPLDTRPFRFSMAIAPWRALEITFGFGVTPMLFQGGHEYSLFFKTGITPEVELRKLRYPNHGWILRFPMAIGFAFYQRHELYDDYQENGASIRLLFSAGFEGVYMMSKSFGIVLPLVINLDVVLYYTQDGSTTPLNRLYFAIETGIGIVFRF